MGLTDFEQKSKKVGGLIVYAGALNTLGEISERQVVLIKKAEEEFPGVTENALTRLLENDLTRQNAENFLAKYPEFKELVEDPIERGLRFFFQNQQ